MILNEIGTTNSRTKGRGTPGWHPDWTRPILTSRHGKPDATRVYPCLLTLPQGPTAWRSRYGCNLAHAHINSLKHRRHNQWQLTLSRAGITRTAYKTNDITNAHRCSTEPRLPNREHKAAEPLASIPTGRDQHWQAGMGNPTPLEFTHAC